MSIDGDLIARLRAEIAEVCQAMLDGECSYIEGSRQMMHLVPNARLDWFEEPFVVFTAIDSETDDVPISEQRDQWLPASSAVKESEWAAAEAYAKKFGEPACRAVISWLKANPIYPD